MAAQVQEIPDPRIVTGQSKREHRAVEDESLQLDYQREEKEGIYGLQEREAEYSVPKSEPQHYGSPQADATKSPEAKPKAERAVRDSRGTVELRTFDPVERSFAKDSMN